MVTEYEITSEAKVNIGVRVCPKEKGTLISEAGCLGIPLSEHVEQIILNRKSGNKELQITKKKLEEEKREKEAMRNAFESAKKRLLNEIQQCKAELLNAKNVGASSNAIAAILEDKRLLQLFQGVKGKKDTVENAKGENFEIVYNTPLDLLAAMIYSFKLKKP
jgi:hypothetical protein